MSNEVPEPWAEAMIAAGFTDPRYSYDVPSRRRLAEAADTTTSTISAMIAGTRDTNGDIVQRVAKALKMEHRAHVVANWVGNARTESKPFRPHRDADLLTSEEQEAVNELIRLLALPKKQGGLARGNTAPNTPLPPNVTQDDLDRVRRERQQAATRRQQRAANRGRSKGKELRKDDTDEA